MQESQKKRRKKEKALLMQGRGFNINAEFFGGGIKTVSCQLAPRLMLPKEVKNGHIAKGKKPVEPEESDCKAFCDFDEFFHDFVLSRAD